MGQQRLKKWALVVWRSSQYASPTVSKIFYGYVDYTDDGRPFYVGKGDTRRVSEPRRNVKHWRVSKKHGQTRVIELASKDEGAVFEWEIATIARHGTYESRHSGIGCNFTEGGEGPSGHRHGPE